MQICEKNLYTRTLFVYLPLLNPYDDDYGKCSEVFQTRYQLVIFQLPGIDGGHGQDGAVVRPHQVSVDIPVESRGILSREGFGVSPDSVGLCEKRRGEGAGRAYLGVD